MIAGAAAFLVAALAGAMLQPWLRAFCERSKHVDSPDAKRKLQSSPVALSGGIAVALAAVAAIAGIIAFAPAYRPNASFFIFAAGAGIALILGIIDDRIALCAWQKLLGQVLAAACAYYSGISLNLLDIPFVGQPVELGHAALPLTLLWFAACMNGYNFIDGSDLGAAGTAFAISTGIFVISALSGKIMVALITVSLLGALVPFCWHNRPPASVYLGDAGAMFVGYLLAGLILAALPRATGLPAASAILIMGYPLYEVITTPIRRWRRGQPLGNAERGHPHFAMLAKGASPELTAMVVTLANLIMVSLGVIAYVGSDAAVATAIAVALGLTVWFSFRLDVIVSKTNATS